MCKHDRATQKTVPSPLEKKAQLPTVSLLSLLPLKTPPLPFLSFLSTQKLIAKTNARNTFSTFDVSSSVILPPPGLQSPCLAQPPRQNTKVASCFSILSFFVVTLLSIISMTFGIIYLLYTLPYLTHFKDEMAKTFVTAAPNPHAVRFLGCTSDEKDRSHEEKEIQDHMKATTCT